MEVRITRKADLRYRLRVLEDDASRKAVREAIGIELTSMAKQAFDNPSMRPYAWKKRVSGGTHPLLKKTGNLQRSLTLPANPRDVRLRSSTVYAGVHQFGSPKQNISARPFFPIVRGGLTPEAREAIKEIIRVKMISLTRR
jgi:phage gpG-like protein